MDYINYETQYLSALNNILNQGVMSNGRNGLTLKLPNLIFSIDLWRDFPILTTKRVPYKTAIKELLWMFRDQSNDVTKLQEQNVHIWDNWVDENNTIGKSYGYQVNNCKQFDILLDTLKNDNQSRRMIVDLWNVKDLPDMTLQPCTFCTIWDVCDMSDKVNSYMVDTGKSIYPTKDKYLNMTLVQRSGDMAIGVPFDILEYSILLSMIAEVSGMKPGKLTHVITNSHIYYDHIEGVRQQIERLPLENKAILKLNSNITNFYDFTCDDIKIENYKSYDAIKYDVIK